MPQNTRSHSIYCHSLSFSLFLPAQSLPFSFFITLLTFSLFLSHHFPYSLSRSHALSLSLSFHALTTHRLSYCVSWNVLKLFPWHRHCHPQGYATYTRGKWHDWCLKRVFWVEFSFIMFCFSEQETPSSFTSRELSQCQSCPGDELNPTDSQFGATGTSLWTWREHSSCEVNERSMSRDQNRSPRKVS